MLEVIKGVTPRTLSISITLTGFILVGVIIGWRACEKAYAWRALSQVLRGDSTPVIQTLSFRCPYHPQQCSEILLRDQDLIAELVEVLSGKKKCKNDKIDVWPTTRDIELKVDFADCTASTWRSIYVDNTSICIADSEWLECELEPLMPDYFRVTRSCISNPLDEFLGQVRGICIYERLPCILTQNSSQLD